MRRSITTAGAVSPHPSFPLSSCTSLLHTFYLGPGVSKRLTHQTEQSWGDDLESLGYVLIYLARGGLPWGRESNEPDGLLEERVRMLKEDLNVETICSQLPAEFATYLDYTRGLGFRDKPRYGYLRGLFRRAFKREGFAYDHVFDWTERLYHESADE